ncbi:MAG TPA: hypothetical protein VF058_03425 [Actinomycetota bacterium]
MASPRFRAIAGLVAAAVVLGVFTLSPVSAHFTQNTKHLGNHAWKQVIKKKADKRYLRKTKVVVVEDSITATSNKQTDALCPGGWQALGGGINFQSTDPAAEVTWNEPLIDGDNLNAAGEGTHPAADGWRVRVDNDSGVTYTYAVGVICARA